MDKKKSKAAIALLEQARARISSLENDPSDLKLELRPAHNGGFAKARREAQRILTEMLAELQ